METECDTCEYKKEVCANLYFTFKAFGLHTPCGDYVYSAESDKDFEL